MTMPHQPEADEPLMNTIRTDPAEPLMDTVRAKAPRSLEDLLRNAKIPDYLDLLYVPPTIRPLPEDVQALYRRVRDIAGNCTVILPDSRAPAPVHLADLLLTYGDPGLRHISAQRDGYLTITRTKERTAPTHDHIAPTD